MDHEEIEKEGWHELLRARQLVEESMPGGEKQQQRLLHDLRVHQIELEMQNQELREAQQQLEESRSRYADLYYFAPLGYLTLDAGGCIREINLTGADLLGVERSRLLHMSFAAYVAKSEADKFREHLRRCMQGESQVTTELGLVTKQGQPYVVQLSSVAVEEQDRQPAVYRTVFVNITERKRAEEEICRMNAELEQRVRGRTAQLEAANQKLLSEIFLRKQSTRALQLSEEKFRALIENSSDVITILNADATIRYESPSIERVLGYMPKEMIDKQACDFVHPDDAPALRETFNEIVATAGVTRSAEFRFRHRDGFWCVFESFGKRFVDNAGIAVVVNSRNITLRKQAEKELRLSREQLRNHYVHLQTAIEQERTRIAREIHDELGQALTALKMDLAWLDQKMSGHLKALRSKSQVMLKSIDNYIKSVQRISADLRPRLLDDLGLSAAIEWQAREFHERTGIEYQMTFFPEDIVIDQERSTLVFRIFQETLTNIARHAQATRVRISLQQHERKLQMKVRDNGRGITPEQIVDGKSFGLMGMRERVHPLKGKIKIKGRPGRGTIVFLSMPLHPVSA